VHLAEVQERVERVSARYARTAGIERDPDWYVMKMQEEVGELVAAHLAASGRARARGRGPEARRTDLERECADVVAHALLLAGALGVDVERALAAKWWPWLGEQDGCAGRVDPPVADGARPPVDRSGPVVG
jgi:NTP pyrophosphatase (non-canonical NTP hydrolase)